MKKNTIITLLIVGLLGGFTAPLCAQTLKSSDLEGLWRMKMDISADGLLLGDGNDDPITSCLLKITPQQNGEFEGEFTQCGFQKYIAGSMYNNRLMNAVLYGNEGDKYVYTGRVTPEGTLKGNYFTPTCLYGEFEWEKVPTEAATNMAAVDNNLEGNPIPLPDAKEKPVTYSYTTPPSATARKVGERVEKYQVAKTVLVDDTHAYDPNLPMAQPYNGTDAIYAGKIDGITKTIYETQTRIIPIYAEPTPPVQEQIAAPKYEFKKYEMATAASTTLIKPAVAPTPIPQETIKKIDFCDATTPGIKPDYVERGKKVTDKTGEFHIVGHGETMYAISRYYNIQVGDLITWNGKECEHLKQGEKIRVSPRK